MSFGFILYTKLLKKIEKFRKIGYNIKSTTSRAVGVTFERRDAYVNI